MSSTSVGDMTADEIALIEGKVNIDKDAIAVKPIVIQYVERLETEEELKKRKEEEEKKAAAEKNVKKKPPAKGAAVVEDPMDKPQIVKEPITNSLDMGFSMPAFTKWATSQIQMCKDRFIRDCDTGDEIWKRIYPQQDGMPVISPSGKYWVKIKLMGKERLVEIDDRIPCDHRKNPLFAQSQNIMELWPQLLMKAIIKAYSYKWYSLESQLDKEVGNGTIMYALTGLIPEYVSFKDFEKDGLPLLRSLLNDDMYFGNKAFVTCYCEESFRPKLPSVLMMNKAQTEMP